MQQSLKNDLQDKAFCQGKIKDKIIYQTQDIRF